MQLVGFGALIGLVALMSLSGFQIVPESATSYASGNDAGTRVNLLPAGVTIDSTTASSRTSIAATTTTVVFTPAKITGQAAQNVESDSALLRGQVLVGSESLGAVFYVYGYDRTDVDRSIANHTTYDKVLQNKRTEARVTRVARSLNRDQNFSTRVRNLAPDTAYYVRLCAELRDQLSCSQVTTFRTTPRVYSVADVRVPTLRVDEQSTDEADEMLFTVRVDMRDTVDGDVYLIYGESQRFIEAARGQSYRAVEEEDDLWLQKTRIIREIRGTQQLITTVDDLREDRVVYYVVCVEYDGERDGVVCSRTRSFTTHDEDYGSSPRVRTDAVVAQGTQARLTGSVRMEDFFDGKVFFVYGSDLERITTTEGEVSMERLRQAKDRFQRVLVDADLDGNDEYTQTVRDLQPETLYAARLCVEYTNQNANYREVPFVECGELRSFLTQ